MIQEGFIIILHIVPISRIKVVRQREKVKSKNDVKVLAKKIYKNYGTRPIIAIDGPRCWAKGPGFGRECEREIVGKIKSSLLWTPSEGKRNKKHEWMEISTWFFDAFGPKKPNVIEVFPAASYPFLEKSRISFTLPTHAIKKKYREDILDAICAAVTGFYYSKGKYEGCGNEKEGYIILPRL